MLARNRGSPELAHALLGIDGTTLTGRVRSNLQYTAYDVVWGLLWFCILTESCVFVV
jgi:hypothetical protein